MPARHQRRWVRDLFLLLFLLPIGASWHAQEAAPPTAEAKLSSQGVVVDGRLDASEMRRDNPLDADDTFAVILDT